MPCSEKNRSKFEKTCGKKVGTKLKDCKSLGGKGRLTESEVDKLQNY